MIRRRAFTLIELCIVVAIVTPCVAAAFTFYRDVQNRQWEIDIRLEAERRFAAIGGRLRADASRSATSEPAPGACMFTLPDGTTALWHVDGTRLVRDSGGGSEVVAMDVVGFTASRLGGSGVEAAVELEFTDGARWRRFSRNLCCASRVAP